MSRPFSERRRVFVDMILPLDDVPIPAALTRLGRTAMRLRRLAALNDVRYSAIRIPVGVLASTSNESAQANRAVSWGESSDSVRGATPTA